jgi:hypothetical protein
MIGTFDLALLAELVRQHLGRTTSLHLMPIRTGKHNASFWVDSDDFARSCPTVG